MKSSPVITNFRMKWNNTMFSKKWLYTWFMMWQFLFIIFQTSRVASCVAEESSQSISKGIQSLFSQSKCLIGGAWRELRAVSIHGYKSLIFSILVLGISTCTCTRLSTYPRLKRCEYWQIFLSFIKSGRNCSTGTQQGLTRTS